MVAVSGFNQTALVNLSAVKAKIAAAIKAKEGQ